MGAPLYANQSHSTTRYLPTYSSAHDISCKMLSADRVWQQLKIPAHAETDPNVTCTSVCLFVWLFVFVL